MKRIVRLTESDLARIVRRVISENIQENLDDIINTYGKLVEKALGKNFQLAAHEEDYNGDEVPGTYESYFIQNYDYGSEWGTNGNGIALNFRAKKYETKGSIEGTISFSVIFSNNLPIKIETCFWITSKAISLLDSDLNKSILPKIKNIKFDYKTKKAQVCGHNTWEEYKKSNWSCKTN
jgi:hypothetical protein